MRTLAAFLFFLVAAVRGAIEVEDGVLVLTDANFDEAIEQNPVTLVEFYAPWCGHCKKLDPEYRKAAQALAGEPVKLAKVDCTVQTDVAQQFGIKGFPTLKLFKNGKPSEYSGGRTSSEIVSWMKKQSGPAAKTISTKADLEQVRESSSVFVVGYFAEGSSNAKAFEALAGDDDSLEYVVTHSADLKNELALSSEAVVILKTFDDRRADFAVSGDLNKAEAAEFVRANSVPLVQEFSQETAKRIFSSPIQQHALFFTDKDASHHGSTVSLFLEVAKQFKGKALFVNVPATENRVMEFFGLKAADLPALVAADLSSEGSMKKFPFSGEFTSNEVTDFIAKFVAKELKPTLKTEAREAADTAGDVVVLRGESFNELVLDNQKDVLVEFYAPWCGHCKKLAPIWDELGKKVKAVSDNIVIAKMDSTANEIDVEGVNVRGYPTIYYFKGTDKIPRVYEGAREYEDFVAFLKENASQKFNHDEL